MAQCSKLVIVQVNLCFLNVDVKLKIKAGDCMLADYFPCDLAEQNC